MAVGELIEWAERVLGLARQAKFGAREGARDWKGGYTARVKLFRFDGVDSGFELLPMAARRALDHAGRKLSLEGFRSLTLAEREALAELGCSEQVDVSVVLQLAERGKPAPEVIEPVADPSPVAPSDAVVVAFGPARLIPAASWSALGSLERYALSKVALGKKEERRQNAYDEIMSSTNPGSKSYPVAWAGFSIISCKILGDTGPR